LIKTREFLIGQEKSFFEVFLFEKVAEEVFGR
jgi:hypothetical protein